MYLFSFFKKKKIHLVIHLFSFLFLQFILFNYCNTSGLGAFTILFYYHCQSCACKYVSSWSRVYKATVKTEVCGPMSIAISALIPNHISFKLIQTTLFLFFFICVSIIHKLPIRSQGCFACH